MISTPIKPGMARLKQMSQSSKLRKRKLSSNPNVSFITVFTEKENNTNNAWMPNVNKQMNKREKHISFVILL